MARWDVFHSDRLEVERGLEDAAVQSSVAQGGLTEDDLIRPAGSTLPWERLGDRPDLLAPPAPPLPPAPPPSTSPVDRAAERTEMDTAMLGRLEHEVDESISRFDISGRLFDVSDFEDVDPENSIHALQAVPERPDDDGLEFVDASPPPTPPQGPILPPISNASAVPRPGPSIFEENEFDADLLDADIDAEYDPLEEDEAVAEFTFARESPETIEELDLAAMVDVAFQLVLFFLVTAATVLYKSLEVPKPNNDAPPEAAAQGRSKTIDDFKDDFILVEIDPTGTLKIDRQPVPGELTMPGLAEKLRTLRTDTGRQAMLLSADFATPHRNAVLAYDAANEIGMRIAIAKPAAPTPPSVAKKG